MVVLIRTVSIEKQSLKNRRLPQILKKIILKQRVFQFLSGRGVYDTDERKFLQYILQEKLLKRMCKKSNFENSLA